MQNTNSIFDLTDDDFEGAELTDEMENALYQHSHQANKQARKQKRLHDCGNWSYYFDPHTGNRLAYPFQCKMFRDCQQCRRQRAYKEYAHLHETVVREDPLVAFDISFDEAEMLTRGKGKDQYIRYPQADTEIVIMKQRDTVQEGTLVTSKWLTEQNWLEIVNTPEGRNKSGTLHMPREKKEVVKFTFVPMKYFTSDAPYMTVINAMDEATDQTSDHLPATPEEVKTGLDERIKIATRKLKKLGFVVTMYVKQVKIEHDKIDWEISRSINKVNTQKTFGYAQEVDVGLQDAFIVA